MISGYYGTLACCTASFFILSAVAAQGQSADLEITTMGRATCAKWLSAPTDQHDGEIWLLGYLSGLNKKDPYPLKIGTKNAEDVFLREVHSICDKGPNLTLEHIGASIYERFQQGVFDNILKTPGPDIDSPK
jgi:hypothetical protein